MGGLTQQTPGTPVPARVEERDHSRRTIVIAVVAVMAVMLGIALFFREPPKVARTTSPYAANLKFSDFKMSAEENFVGATVSYMEGTVTNSGNQTVTSAVLEVTFKDELGQVAQQENVALRLLKTSGPYPEAVDLAAVPLAPQQSQPYRLSFDSISKQWNHRYPDIKVVDLTTK
jgi:Protein of unknown function (DUF2393)